MSTILIPSLSGGWLTNPQEQMSYMMAAVLTSDYSQSTVYAGDVVSLPWIVAQNQNKKDIIVELTEAGLIKMFSRVFDSVQCTVTADDGTDVQYNINIDLSVVKNGKGYTLLTSALVENGILQQVIDTVQSDDLPNLY